jgi:hypothetical protein
MVAQTSPHAQLMVQTGHYGHVDAVAFSPDGRYVLNHPLMEGLQYDPSSLFK